MFHKLIQTGGHRIAYQESRRPHRGGGSETLVLVHASASGPAQWRALLESAPLNHRHLRLLAPALCGYAGTRRENAAVPDADDDVGALMAFIDGAAPAEPVHLVGDSYGAATALALAAAWGDTGRVLSLTLFEPARFNLLRHLGYDELYRSIHTISHHQIALVEDGAIEAAARSFMRYWNGPGSWERLSPMARTKTKNVMPKVASEWRRVWRWDRELGALSRVVCPVQLISGSASPPAALAVIHCLRALLPHTHTRIVSGAGHRAPITHPQIINRWLLDHVDACMSRGGGLRAAAR